MASNVLNVFVSFGSFILISQYLQLVLGLSPLQAGLLSVPASLPPSLDHAQPNACATHRHAAQRGWPAGDRSDRVRGAHAVGGPLPRSSWRSLGAVGVGGSAAATLTTGTIISAHRRAGRRGLGRGAGGCGVGRRIGHRGTRQPGDRHLSRDGRCALPAGISPELAAAARDTLGGALSVASQAPTPPPRPIWY